MATEKHGKKKIEDKTRNITLKERRITFYLKCVRIVGGTFRGERLLV